MSFCVGTHLIPHPNKVIAHCKLPFVSPLCSMFDVLYRFLETVFNIIKSLVFSKVERGGEDAFFVSNYNGGVIAVADGVFGYETLIKFKFQCLNCVFQM